ncbi:putative MFS-type transporter [Paratrimastix pyriformis]|uniref:MFS-type transporter n=1 Tax=Paratrimastix pyriformis TaxID=342808 RepID=A0ABQ8UUJ7_9EUKA|nr:putative MFS-type transporter [Paratrimastix pyriformis]
MAQEYKLYKRRWLILALYSILSIWIQIIWIAFSPVAELTASYYQVPFFYVDALSSSWMLCFVLFSLAALQVFDRLGPRWGMIIGSTCLVAGCGIRWCGSDPDQFWILFGGQALASFAQLFTLGAPTLISSRWFGEKERVLATTIGSQSSSIGISVGFAMMSVLVHEGSDIPFMLQLQFIVACVLMVLVLLFYRRAPPTPPSRAAAQEVEEEEHRAQEERRKRLARKALRLARKQARRAAKGRRTPGRADDLAPAEEPTPGAAAALAGAEEGGPPADEGAEQAEAINAEQAEPIYSALEPSEAPEGPKGAQAPLPPKCCQSSGSMGALWYFARLPAVWLHVLTTGTVMGSFWTLSTVLDQVVAPLGVTDEAAGWLAAVAGFSPDLPLSRVCDLCAGSFMTLAGIIGALVLSPLVDRFKNFKRFQVALALLYTGMLVGFTVITIPPWIAPWGSSTPQPWGTWPLWVLTGGVGLVLFGMEPIAMELAAEVSFPLISEGSSCTFVMMGANGSALALQMIMNALADPATGHFLWSMVMLTGVTTAMSLAMIFVPAPYHRLAFERYHKHLQAAEVAYTPEGIAEVAYTPEGIAAAAPTAPAGPPLLGADLDLGGLLAVAVAAKEETLAKEEAQGQGQVVVDGRGDEEEKAVSAPPPTERTPLLLARALDSPAPGISPGASERTPTIGG